MTSVLAFCLRSEYEALNGLHHMPRPLTARFRRIAGELHGCDQTRKVDCARAFAFFHQHWQDSETNRLGATHLVPNWREIAGVKGAVA